MNPWLRETFASLRVPAYRVLWFSVLLNFAALWASIVSRGFLAFDLTDSAAALGLLFLGFGLPMLVLSPIGGVIADRWPRKTVTVISQWSFAATNTVLAVLVLADVIELWMLFAGSISEGIGVALGIPARQALIGDLVDDDDIGNAVALQQVSFNGVRIIAPTVAGLLIAVDAVGIGGVYLLQSVAYAAAAMVAMRLPSVEPRPAEKHVSPLAGITQGIRYIRGRPAILTLVLFAYAIEMTAFSYMVFIPAVVDDLFDGGSVALGVMTTTIAAGAFAASLRVAWLADRASGWTFHLLAALVFGPLLIAFALSPVFAVALLIGVALGGAETGFLSMNQSLSMRFSHSDYYGRVQSVLLFGFALNGLVGFPVGLIADIVGLRQAMVGLGVASSVLVLLVLLYSRRIDARSDAHPFAEAAPVEPSAAS
ncbi:MAG: MFS transporter [Dehalococcoidia bacterium]|nr:MFS transporter [Dehalococcoidia bacterium]